MPAFCLPGAAYCHVNFHLYHWPKISNPEASTMDTTDRLATSREISDAFKLHRDIVRSVVARGECVPQRPILEFAGHLEISLVSLSASSILSCLYPYRVYIALTDPEWLGHGTCSAFTRSSLHEIALEGVYIHTASLYVGSLISNVRFHSYTCSILSKGGRVVSFCLATC